MSRSKETLAEVLERIDKIIKISPDLNVEFTEQAANYSWLSGYYVDSKDRVRRLKMSLDLLKAELKDKARERFKGQKVTDNTLRGPNDYEAFTITAPQDPRLPDGGGYPIALSMLRATAPAGAQNYVTFESDFGPERRMYWHGVDLTVNARLRQGLIMQLVTQNGRSIEDT